jgi:hypothetical protein
MADQKSEIVARFTPPFDGAFFRHVPQQDMTQADVDRLTPEQRRDAFTPHPAYGTPLFTAVHPDLIDEQAKFAAAALAPAWVESVDDTAGETISPKFEVTELNTLPKWFIERQEKAEPGRLLSTPLAGETQKEYDQRIAQFAPPDDGGHEDGAE